MVPRPWGQDISIPILDHLPPYDRQIPVPTYTCLTAASNLPTQNQPSPAGAGISSVTFAEGKFGKLTYHQRDGRRPRSSFLDRTIPLALFPMHTRRYCTEPELHTKPTSPHNFLPLDVHAFAPHNCSIFDQLPAHALARTTLPGCLS